MSGNALLTKQQGESVNFKFDRDGDSITGYICTITLKQFAEDTTELTRIIAPDTTTESFSDFLTSTETASLALGTWWLTGTLVNATTDEQEQIPIRINFTKKWA